MKREIKFRVWNVASQLMYDAITLQSILEGDIVRLNLENGLLWSRPSFEDDDIKIMQSTGLYDKNGKEIYEGDYIKQIVYATNFNKRHFGIKSPTEKIATIVWDDDNACFITEFSPNDQWHPNYEVFRILDADVEVIGNIYESGDVND